MDLKYIKYILKIFAGLINRFFSSAGVLICTTSQQSLYWLMAATFRGYSACHLSPSVSGPDWWAQTQPSLSCLSAWTLTSSERAWDTATAAALLAVSTCVPAMTMDVSGSGRSYLAAASYCNARGSLPWSAVMAVVCCQETNPHKAQQGIDMQPHCGEAGRSTGRPW